MPYEPENPPTIPDIPELETYLAQEFRRIAESFLNIEEILLVELNVEPEKPRDGMVVLADGTNWNPGSGAGFYGRQGGSWTFLG